MFENDRRQDAVQAVTAAVHASLLERPETGLRRPYARRLANPPKARICTGNPDQGSLQAPSCAISVQFRANSPNSMELHRPNVCIASARAREARDYADDAEEMLLADQLVGEACPRRARSMDSRERTVVAVFGALLRRRGPDRPAAAIGARRQPVPHRGPPARTRRGVAGALRVRHGIRRAGAARDHSDACSSRCRTSRS